MCLYETCECAHASPQAMHEQYIGTKIQPFTVHVSAKIQPFTLHVSAKIQPFTLHMSAKI